MFNYNIFARKTALEILYEDNHLIAVNKNNNDIVQQDNTGDPSLEDRVKEYIKNKYNKPGNVFLGVCHRIDRPVSGVVLFAKTSKALVRLNKMFQESSVRKIYWAIVKNKPANESDTLVHYIDRNTQKNKSVALIKPSKSSKRAELDYEILHSSENYYLLQINLKTGRHHQIRAQLSKIGSPIKGDLKYGFDRSNPNGGISLHSRSVAFIHPVTNQQIIIEATPPDDSLWNFFCQK